jgi:hypothetical protein
VGIAIADLSGGELAGLRGHGDNRRRNLR